MLSNICRKQHIFPFHRKMYVLVILVVCILVIYAIYAIHRRETIPRFQDGTVIFLKSNQYLRITHESTLSLTDKSQAQPFIFKRDATRNYVLTSNSSYELIPTANGVMLRIFHAMDGSIYTACRVGDKIRFVSDGRQPVVFTIEPDYVNPIT